MIFTCKYSLMRDFPLPGLNTWGYIFICWIEKLWEHLMQKDCAPPTPSFQRRSCCPLKSPRGSVRTWSKLKWGSGGARLVMKRPSALDFEMILFQNFANINNPKFWYSFAVAMYAWPLRQCPNIIYWSSFPKTVLFGCIIYYIKVLSWFEHVTY